MTTRVSSEGFVDAATAAGFGPWIGVPCSYLRPFIDYVIDRDDLSYVAATNEGEALAIAAGSWIGGRLPVVMLQNSGLGNLVNPLASLSYPFRAPALLIITLRGEPGVPDEPQHQLMGRATGALLAALEVPYEWFPESDAAVADALQRALAHSEHTGRPSALILRKDRVTPYTPRATASPRHAPSRREALAAVAGAIGPDTVVVATTGFTGREWFEVADRDRNLYLVGSMGCAPSVALGIAQESHAPIVVLDGDGAALMRLEAWASIGHHRPPRFVHVVLDNEAYDSTGAQRTISGSVDFPGIARAVGYATAQAVSTVEALATTMLAASDQPGPHLIHLRIATGAGVAAARPSIAPEAVARRLRRSLQEAQG
ncbi:MAG: phosphonopyruvate decarboxylase [Gemmatimonadaceae bacterium]|nr:phosphonopyruvate decarboxylase [Gemmatimonadaceae bacterium]